MQRFIGVILLGLTLSGGAWADTTSDIADLQRQINELREQVARVTVPVSLPAVAPMVVGACSQADAATSCGAQAGACGAASAGACGAVGGVGMDTTRRQPVRTLFKFFFKGRRGGC